ncbi:MAG: hypothetical protein AABY22_19430 [Nanoarchaeota archaeon]
MDLSNYKLSVKQDTAPTYLHSVVKVVCEYLYGENCNDSGCWSMWLGIGQRISAGVLLDKLNYAKSREIRSAKYLLTITGRKKSF